jgi:hypothetical protein
MDVGQFLRLGERRLGALEAGKLLVVERRQHRAQPVGALGMVRAGVVRQEGGVRDQERGHDPAL